MRLNLAPKQIKGPCQNFLVICPESPFLPVSCLDFLSLLQEWAVINYKVNLQLNIVQAAPATVTSANMLESNMDVTCTGHELCEPCELGLPCGSPADKNQ